jgi:tetratricopeptide (TPR) repeat protein
VAQQARALAINNDELRAAGARLQAASELSRSEHRLAEANFELARERCCQAIRALQKRISSAVLPNLERVQFTNRLEGSISSFYSKDFERAARMAQSALKAMDKQHTVAPLKTLMPTLARTWPLSTTALFHKGTMLESKGRLSDALECYAQVVERNPNHWLALARLRNLSVPAVKGDF